MNSAGGTSLLFAGDDPQAQRGIRAVVRCEVAPGLNDGAEQAEFNSSGAAAFRAVPLLRVTGTGGNRRVVIGQARVAADPDAPPAVTLALQVVWSEDRGWHEDAAVRGQAEESLIASLSQPAHEVRGEPQTVVAILAKAIVEASRDAVGELRVLRHELEQRLADQLAGRTRGTLRPLLVRLVELSIVLSRACDQAREAVREELWLWLCWEEAYRLVRGVEPHSALPDGVTSREISGWERMHRAAVQHCRRMQAQLGAETEVLHSLLASMSTVAVAEDAEAQQKFNLLAAAAAAGLGLPALILTLYGADTLVPLNSFENTWRMLAPIGIAALLAVVVALRRYPGRPRSRHYISGALLVVSLLALLVFAGLVVPD